MFFRVARGHVPDGREAMSTSRRAFLAGVAAAPVVGMGTAPRSVELVSGWIPRSRSAVRVVWLNPSPHDDLEYDVIRYAMQMRPQEPKP